MSQLNYHIGCGKRDFGKEWVHVDAADFPHVSSKDVFLKDVLPDTVDTIYSSHLIEYFDREEVKKLLSYWYSAMKDGGELRIAVPDFKAITKLYHEKEYELETFLGLLYGRMDGGSGLIYHKTVYDFKSLCRVLSAVGFHGIITADQLRKEDHWYCFTPQDDHSRAVLPHMSATGTPVSLNVICYK